MNRAAAFASALAARTQNSEDEPTHRIESPWAIRVVGPYQPQRDYRRRTAAI